jgi:hypothetical protein
VNAKRPCSKFSPRATTPYNDRRDDKARFIVFAPKHAQGGSRSLQVRCVVGAALKSVKICLYSATQLVVELEC